MTLQERVETIVGSITDVPALEQYLSNAATWLISVASEQMLLRYATVISQGSDASFSAQDKRIHRVDRGGFFSRLHSDENLHRITDVSSLFHARPRSPVHYISGDGLLHVLPEPDALAPLKVTYTASIPTPLATDDTIDGVPPALLRVIVLRTAHAVVQKRIDSRVATDDIELQDAETKLLATVDRWLADEVQSALGGNKNE